MCGTVDLNEWQIGDLEAAGATIKRLRTANDKLGWWMSAALDDPQVCEEMKADIRAWFEVQSAC